MKLTATTTDGLASPVTDRDFGISPWWLITMPTSTPDGRSGTQSFVVQADNAREALAMAEAEAQTTRARAHRRHARVEHQASTVSAVSW